MANSYCPAVPASASSRRADLVYHVPVATILLVDDEKIMRTLMRMALEQQDHEVLEAASTRRALNLARARSGAVDLLVVEIALPGTNGIELSKTLRAECPGMRTLFLSRSPLAAELGEMVLKQPFDMEALVAAVQQQLGEPAGRRKPPARSGQKQVLRKAR